MIGPRLLPGSYGGEALAVIDTASRQKIAEIPLKAHPESFQLDTLNERIYVNVPDARLIAVVDRPNGQQIASWSTATFRANYPMALDPAHGKVFVVVRHPATIAVFEATSGRLLASAETCAKRPDRSCSRS